MPIVSGRRRLRIPSYGRAAMFPQAPGEAAEPVQGNEPSLPDDEGVDLELLDDVGGVLREGREAPRPAGRTGGTISDEASGAMMGFRPRNGRATLPKKARGSRRARMRLLVEEMDREEGYGLPFPDPLVHVFDVQPAAAHGHHGPNSREFRTPTRISEPKPTSSKATFSQTRTPRRESSTAFRRGIPSLPARSILFDQSRNRPGTTASISSQAALTAPASAFDEAHASRVGLVEDERRDDLQDDGVRCRGLRGRLSGPAGLSARRRVSASEARRSPGGRRPRAPGGTSVRPSRRPRRCR